MEYGISTVAYLQLPLADALARIAQLAPLAELRCDSTHCISEPRNACVALAARADGLRFSVHGPFLGQQIWSSDVAVRRAAVADHRRFIELAASVGAEVYVLHPDYSVEPTAADPRIVAALHDSFARLGELQAEFGLIVAVENMPGVGHSHFSSPEFDTDGLPIVVDVGHAHLSACLPEMLERRDIVHWHLHDNLGYGDDPHLAVGQGTIDWTLVLGRVRESVVERGATVVLELNSDADVVASLAYLRTVEGHLPALPAV
ncbi:MAG: sugar phosphate isomerase/epimerase family protein [Thermoleophilia bacterium]